MKKTLLLVFASLAGLWIMVTSSAGQTNNVRPGNNALMVDTNGNLITPTNFFHANTAALNAEVTGGGGGGGGSPTGAAGGSLAGTYPNPSLANTVAAGTATKVTFNAAGQITGTNALTAADVLNVNSLSGATNTGAFTNTGALNVGGLTTLNGVTNKSTLGVTGGTTLSGATNNGLFFDAGNGQFTGSFTCGQFQATSTSGNGALLIASGGIDNCLTLQNTSSAHYSAVRAIDNSGQEVGAWGYGNSNSVYPYEIYIESFGNQSGAYFVAGGDTYGGLQRHTGAFVWYNGVTGNDTNQTIEFLVKNDGTVFAQSNITTSGSIITAPVSGGTFTNVDALGRLNGSLIPTSGAFGILNVQSVQAQGPSPSSGSSGGVAMEIGSTVTLSQVDYGVTIASSTGDMLTLEPTGASTPRLMLKQNLQFYPSTTGWSSLGIPSSYFGYSYTDTNIANYFVGNGAGLTSVTAANVAGSHTLPAGVLPTDVPFTDSANNFTLANSFGTNLYCAQITYTNGISTIISTNLAAAISAVTNRIVDMSKPVQFVSMAVIAANVNFLYATNLITDTNYQECLLQIKGDGTHSLYFTNGGGETITLHGLATNGFVPGASNGLYTLAVSRLKVPGQITNTTYALTHPNN